MVSLFSSAKSTMVAPERALPGRDAPAFEPATTHLVLGTPLLAPYPAGHDVLYVGLGCFWGAEKRFWRVPGVFTTVVGYQGGMTPWPTYDEVCTGRTGHAENVAVVYDPTTVATYDLLKVFWENHDPTQGYRQGNDVGTQYRSALYWTTPEQQDLAERTRASFDALLRDKGYGEVTTEVSSAEGKAFYVAEPYHQQYLFSHPHGYDCHAETGLLLPAL